jgi:tellurite resistance protein
MFNTLTVKPEILHKAVCAVLEGQREDKPARKVSQRVLLGRLPSLEWLKAGAVESTRQSSENVPSARYFQALLELGYLVASADGLAEKERDTLAQLVEHVTGAAVGRETLQLHFHDLDASSEALGRSERLGRAASEFETVEAQQEAISFSALVAIADGELTEPEMSVLIKLGEHFSLSEQEVRALVNQVADKIETALAQIPAR